MTVTPPGWLLEQHGTVEAAQRAADEALLAATAETVEARRVQNRRRHRDWVWTLQSTAGGAAVGENGGR